jgi:molybdopterin/thiamine biosynthesis adenylyltransferase
VAGINDRQRDALGLAHDRLRALHVGVVGAGGLGSEIAEQLARMGVAERTLIDDDVLDTPPTSAACSDPRSPT